MSSSKAVAPIISKEDYYTKSLEFKLYLLEYHAKYLHDLPSDESRHIFKKKFVKKWNARELPEKYYHEERMLEIAPSQLSHHQWKIKGALETLESQNLRQKIADHTTGLARHSNAPPPPPPPPSVPSAKVIGPTMPPKTVAVATSTVPLLDRKRLADDEEAEEQERKRKYEKYQLKKDREDRELLLDEVAPKKEGHAAMVDKRRQAHQRSASPDGPELRERDIYGSADDYHRRLAAQKAQQRSRNEEKEKKVQEKQLVLQDKVQAYQDKESKLMEMFKQLAQSKAQQQ